MEQMRVRGGTGAANCAGRGAGEEEGSRHTELVHGTANLLTHGGLVVTSGRDIAVGASGGSVVVAAGSTPLSRHPVTTSHLPQISLLHPARTVCRLAFIMIQGRWKDSGEMSRGGVRGINIVRT